MNDIYNLGVEVGKKLFAKEIGVNVDTFDYINKKANKSLEDKDMQMILSKVASDTLNDFEVGDKYIYNKIYENGGCKNKHAAALFMEPVIYKIANSSPMEKKAIIGSIFKSAPELAYKTILIGGLGGAGLAALGWSLFRDVNQKDADVETKIEQARMYRQIARDLQKKIDANKKEDKKKNKGYPKDIIEEYGDSNYVL